MKKWLFWLLVLLQVYTIFSLINENIENAENIFFNSLHINFLQNVWNWILILSFPLSLIISIYAIIKKQKLGYILFIVTVIMGYILYRMGMAQLAGFGGV